MFFYLKSILYRKEENVVSIKDMLKRLNSLLCRFKEDHSYKDYEVLIKEFTDCLDALCNNQQQTLIFLHNNIRYTLTPELWSYQRSRFLRQEYRSRGKIQLITVTENTYFLALNKKSLIFIKHKRRRRRRFSKTKT